MSLYTCPNHRVYNTKSEPSYKLRTLGDNNVRVASSVVTKVPLRWGILKIEKTMNDLRKEVYGKSLYLWLNFATNLNLL